MQACPFCGSMNAPHVIDNVSLGWCDDLELLAYTVVCDAVPSLGGCGATCGFHETEAVALEAWHQRAQAEDTKRLDYIQKNLLRRASMRFGLQFKEVNAWTIASDHTDLRAAVDGLQAVDP